jgi:hypothetical protein
MPARISSVEWFSTTKTSTFETTGETERAEPGASRCTLDADAREADAADAGAPDSGAPDADAPDDATVGAEASGTFADEHAAEVRVRARAGAAARAVSRIGRDSRR